MPRSSKKQESPDLMAIAKILNGGTTEGLLPESGGAIRVNGTKQVVVRRAEGSDFLSGRLPAHASAELRKLAAEGLSGRGAIEEVKVPAGGKYRAGWRADEFVVYHHPE
ncbi:hypothetical protein KJ713_02270 [Patescibacteria group bacterium]|nr:hypothetical protein [Patescibacteria group bacterium]